MREDTLAESADYQFSSVQLENRFSMFESKWIFMLYFCPKHNRNQRHFRGSLLHIVLVRRVRSFLHFVFFWFIISSRLFIVLVFVAVDVVVITIFIIVALILLLLLLSLPSSSLFVSIVFNWPLQEFTFPMSLFLSKLSRLNTLTHQCFRDWAGRTWMPRDHCYSFIVCQNLFCSHIHKHIRTRTCYLDSLPSIRCVSFAIITLKVIIHLRESSVQLNLYYYTGMPFLSPSSLNIQF